MSYTDYTLLAAAGLFLAMLLLLETGRRLGIRLAQRDVAEARAGVGAVEAAVFGLMGLLVAFSFSGAMTRLDARRKLIVDETNAIHTAYLRLDLLSASAQAPLRDSFRRYLDSRLETYRKFPDIPAVEAELARSNQIQREIWTQTVTACRDETSPAPTMLLVPAVNAMLEITTTRKMATEMHPPLVIFVMLVGLALMASLLAGYGMAAARVRPWLHMIGFAAALAIAVYVILDTEYPRFGLIRVDAFDQALVDLRKSMK